jgi:hypothetical protein
MKLGMISKRKEGLWEFFRDLDALTLVQRKTEGLGSGSGGRAPA